MAKSFPIEVTHRPTLENPLIMEAICRYCSLMIGASPKPENLCVVERAHSCPEKVRAHTAIPHPQEEICRSLTAAAIQAKQVYRFSPGDRSTSRQLVDPIGKHG